MNELLVRMNSVVRALVAQFRARYMADRWIIATAASLCLPFYLSILFALGCLIYGLCNRSVRQSMFALPGWIPVMSIAGYSALISLIAGNWLGLLASLGLGLACLFWMFVRVRMSPKLFHSMLRAMLGASLVCCTVAVLQVVIVWDLDVYRPTSTMENTNYYAFFAMVCTVCSCYMLLRPNQKRGFYALVLCANLAGILLCQTRSVFVAMPLAVTALLLYRRRYRALLVMGGAVAAIVLVLCLAPGLLPRVSRIGSDTAIRHDIWRTGIEALGIRPLQGGGPWAYRLYAARHDVTCNIVNAHNLPLDLLLNYGFVGCAGIIWIITGLFRQLRDYCARTRMASPFGLVLCVGLALLLQGTLDLAFLGLEPALCLLLLAGLVGNTRTTRPPQRVDDEKNPE